MASFKPTQPHGEREQTIATYMAMQVSHPGTNVLIVCAHLSYICQCASHIA